ncbi:MAG: peroxiredoxin family protein [Prolixibacteraceae bacterium]|nr:peroxiredoxin family protein [Prolixibacteraceae bacterium]
MRNFLCLIVTLSMCFILTGTINAKDDVEVQYIAVHFGEPANAEILDKEDFPAFNFYQAKGELMAYTEDQKFIGNPTHLEGWYGEVPEKMGFCASYRGEYKKSKGFPYDKGAVYVLDKNGTVAYQLPPQRFNPDNYSDLYSAIYSDIKKTIRKMSRGKEAKILKENKREYIKESPVGELETTKGSKVDTRVKGIVGWPVPPISLNDCDGNKTDLSEIANGKVTVLVFYTLNGAKWLRGDNEGNIKSENVGEKLIPYKKYLEQQNEEFEKKAAEGDLGAMFGMAAKEKFSNVDAMNAIRKGIELSDKEKAAAYKKFVQHLEMVQTMSE